MIGTDIVRVDLRRGLTVLVEARRRIAAGWTQGAWYRDMDGTPTREYIPHARGSFCLTAAVTSAVLDKKDGHWGAASIGRDEEFNAAAAAVYNAAAARGYESAEKFNDDPATTQADVLTLLDETIASIEASDGPLVVDGFEVALGPYRGAAASPGTR